MGYDKKNETEKAGIRLLAKELLEIDSTGLALREESRKHKPGDIKRSAKASESQQISTIFCFPQCLR